MRKLRFRLDSANAVLPTQYIIEKVRGLNPTHVKIDASVAHGSELKAKSIIDRVNAQMNVPPPDDSLAAQVYAKYKQISEDVVMDALATVRFHEEHAMYYLLATNTLAEDIAVSNIIQITRSARPATSGFARFGLTRALVLKHGMGVQAVHDLLEFTKK